MRRILLVLTVALVMAAMMAVTATSAFAKPSMIDCDEWFVDPIHGKYVVVKGELRGNCVHGGN